MDAATSVLADRGNLIQGYLIKGYLIKGFCGLQGVKHQQPAAVRPALVSRDVKSAVIINIVERVLDLADDVIGAAATFLVALN